MYLYFNPLRVAVIQTNFNTGYFKILLSANPHVSSKADVAFFIFKVMGLVVMISELVFCLEELFVSAAFARPFLIHQHGAVKLRNDWSDTEGSLVFSIRAENIPHPRWLLLSVLGMK